MDPVTGWTGRTACALQAALRLSNEAFAEHWELACARSRPGIRNPRCGQDPRCSKSLTRRLNRHRRRSRRDSPCSWAIRQVPDVRLRTPHRGKTARRPTQSGGSAPTRTSARRSTDSISTPAGSREPPGGRSRPGWLGWTCVISGPREPPKAHRPASYRGGPGRLLPRTGPAVTAATAPATARTARSYQRPHPSRLAGPRLPADRGP